MTLRAGGRGFGSPNMEFVANLQFPPDDRPQGSYAATEMDFATYRGNNAGKVLPPGARGGTERVFAFVGTALNGLQIVDVTDPTAPERVSFLQMRKGTHQTTVHPSGEYV